MAVLPCRANIFLDHKGIYQFLLVSQQNCTQNSTQIVSISLEIPKLDPLLALDKLTKPNQLSFYLENKNKGEAIAAIDAVAKLKVEGKERFYAAQKFINSCLTNTVPVGAINHPFAGPHFFCSCSAVA